MTSMQDNSKLTNNGSDKDKRMTQLERSHQEVKDIALNIKHINQNNYNSENSKVYSVDGNTKGENTENEIQDRRPSSLENSLANDTDVSSSAIFHRRRVEFTPRGSRRSNAISPITPHKNNMSVSSIDNSKIYENESKQHITQPTDTETKINKKMLANDTVRNHDDDKNAIITTKNNLSDKMNHIIKPLSNFCQNDSAGNKQEQDNANGVNEVVRARAVRMDTACYISPARSNSSSREVVHAIDNGSITLANAAKTNNNNNRLSENTNVSVNNKEMPMQPEQKTSREKKESSHRPRHRSDHHNHHHHHYYHNHHHHNYPTYHHRHHENDSNYNYINKYKNEDYYKPSEHVQEESTHSNRHSRRRAYSHMIPRDKYNSESRQLSSPSPSKSNHPSRETAIESQHKDEHIHKYNSDRSGDNIRITEPHQTQRTRSYTAHATRVHNNSASPSNYYSSRSNTQTRDNSRIIGHSYTDNTNNNNNNNLIRYLVIPAMPVQRSSVIIPARRASANTNATTVLLTNINTSSPEYLNYVRLNRRTMQSISVPAHNRYNSPRSTMNSNRVDDKITPSFNNPHNANKDEVHSFITRATPVLGKSNEAGDAQTTKAKSTLCDSLDANITNLSMESTRLSKSKSLLCSPPPRMHDKEHANKKNNDAQINDSCTSEADTSLYSNEMERRITESKAWVESMKRKLSSKRRHRTKTKNANKNDRVESEKPITVQREHTHERKLHERHSTNVAGEHKNNAKCVIVVNETENSLQNPSKKYTRHYTEIMFPSSSSSSSSCSSSSLSVPHETEVKKTKPIHAENKINNSVDKSKTIHTQGKANVSSIDAKNNKERNVENICTDNSCQAVDFAKHEGDAFTYHNLQVHKQLMAKAQKERRFNITPITVTLDERESCDVVAVHSSNNSELNASNTDQLNYHKKGKPGATKPENREVNDIHAEGAKHKDMSTSECVESSNKGSIEFAAPTYESSAENDNIYYTNSHKFNTQVAETSNANKDANHCERDLKEIITKDENCRLQLQRQSQKEEEKEWEVDNINAKCTSDDTNGQIHEENVIIELHKEGSENDTHGNVDHTSNVDVDVVQKEESSVCNEETKTQTESHSDVHSVTLTNVQFVSFLDLHTFPSTDELCDYNVNVAERLSDEELDALREVVFNHDEVYFAELLYADDVQSELRVIEKILNSGDDNQQEEVIHLYYNAVDTFNTRCKSAHDLLLTIGEPLISNIACFAKEYLKQKEECNAVKSIH